MSTYDISSTYLVNLKKPLPLLSLSLQLLNLLQLQLLLLLLLLLLLPLLLLLRFAVRALNRAMLVPAYKSDSLHTSILRDI